MDDASRPGQPAPLETVVTQGASGGRSGQFPHAGENLFAGLLLLLVADLVVETVLSRAGVRWVAAGIGLAGIVLALAAWRRYRAAAAAWASVFVLLAILAVTSWMTNGTMAGVVFLRQPTSAVIACVAALGVLLATLTAARLKRLPLPGKALVGLVALYALWSLAWGVIARTPYPALVQGGSAWQRLPFWLQGAFLGVAIVLPAGLLAQLLQARTAFRAGTAAGWMKQSLALILVAAIASSGFAGSTSPSLVTGLVTGAADPLAAPGPGQAGAAAPTAALTDASLKSFPRLEPMAGIPGGAPQSFDEASRRLDRILAVVRGVSGLVDPADVEVAARAEKNGRDVDANFAFVRDAIRWEPYAGALRGAQGTLVAASGNALDRALLLAGLLEHHGLRARIVHGTLTSEQAGRLLSRFFEPPRTGDADTAADVRRLATQAGETELLAAAEQATARGTRAAAWLDARAERSAAVLQKAAGDPGQWFRDRAATAVAEGVRSHYWLQVQQAGAWVDLDPSFPDARAGQRLTEPDRDFGVRALPPETQHRVRITMTAEYLQGERRVEERVLDLNVPTRDVALDQIRVVNYPADVPPGGDLSLARSFQAAARVGRKDYPGKKYWIDGEPAPSMPDIGSALFGAEQPVSRKLTAVWLEIAATGPSAPSRVERRYVMDLVGRAARAAGPKAGTPLEVAAERKAYLAVRVFDVLVMPSPYTPRLGEWMASRSVLDSEGLLRLSLEARHGRADKRAVYAAAARMKTPVFSDALTALGSSVGRYISRQTGETRLAQQGPFIGMFVQGFEPGSVLRNPVGRPLLRQGFDIVAPGAVPVGGTSADRARGGLAYGAYLTDLELALALEGLPPGAAPPDNASAAMEQAGAADARFTVLRNQADAGSLAASADAAAAVRADLESGHLVLAPAAVRDGAATWWRVDPGTGVCLGVNERGEGQAMTEREITMVNIVISAVSGVWCLMKVDRKFSEGEISEGGKKLGVLVCVVGFFAGYVTAFTGSLAASTVGMGVGMLGDICNTN